MEFSLRRVGEENIYYYDSGRESSLQLVFLPGSLNPGLWKHQLRYFSKKYRTISFRPTESSRDFAGEKEALENVLSQKDVDNVVLVSNVFGNPLAQEFESHEKVMSTVLTGALRGDTMLVSKSFYRVFRGVIVKKPKLLKKLLFSDSTDYRIVKEFAQELEAPDFSDLMSFAERYSVSPPSKNSMIVYSENDPLSSIPFSAKTDKTSLSYIKRAGTFSFYEKPQEYNKALHDFLTRLEGLVEEEEIEKARKRNRSLLEFEEEDKSSTDSGQKMLSEKDREKVKIR
ncbi:MAG: alpha/beta fold hydrolase [Candidatus Nanohaloarchaea archaeon]